MRIFRKRNIAVYAVLIFLLLAFFRTSFAEDIALKDLKANTVNISEYYGKSTILFFWTTWCPYCRTEIKELNKIFDQAKSEGINIIGINIGESNQKVEKFFKNYALKLKILLDNEGLLADNYNVNGVPTYIFLDKDGKVVSTEHTLPAYYKNLLFKQKK